MLCYAKSSRAIPLTSRRTEALSLSAAYPNLTTAELAKKLGVANSTMRNLLSEVYMRLQVSSRTAAIDKARRLGLLAPDTVAHDP